MASGGQEKRNSGEGGLAPPLPLFFCLLPALFWGTIFFMEDGMCNHGGLQIIEEGLMEEKWGEGDLYEQVQFDWVFCPECDDDFACYRK